MGQNRSLADLSVPLLVFNGCVCNRVSVLCVCDHMGTVSLGAGGIPQSFGTRL